jgi:GR25 family glycosyltransferase involved in LPS biosynthesis
MSHAKAGARFIEDTKFQSALIIEDDVILGRRLSEVVAALERHATTDRVTLLYSPIYRKVVFEQRATLVDEYRFVEPDSTRNVFGTQAYFVTRGAAAALGRGLLPVRSIADDWQRYVSEGMLAGVNLVYPFPVLHAEFLSVINPASGRIGLRTRVKNYLYYNRVFPFYQIFLTVRRRTAEVRQRSNIVAAGCPAGKTYRL